MKQHLDTIPIWDAYKTACECPLCAIRAANEEQYVDNFLGGSVMEPDTRIEVNEKGFCQRHLKMLYDMRNRLGLALMAHTHLKQVIARLEAMEEGAPKSRGMLRRLTGKEPQQQSGAAALSQGCILCDRLNNTMYRYVLTLLYMWKKEPEFRKAFAQSKGFCLYHYAQVMDAAPEELSGSELEEFCRTLRTLELENLHRIEKDIEWFTLKFDYRNQDKPWGESRDAVERTLNKLRGDVVRPEAD